MSLDVTQLLHAIADGHDSGVDELLPLVYGELRKLAQSFLERERGDHTLQATALVHEAYVRLVGSPQSWEGRAHFFAAAANSMRRILVEWARSHRSQKHGTRDRSVDVNQFASAEGTNPDMILSLDESLSRLAAVDAEAAELVKLRLFAGLSVTEAGRSLSLSRSTAYEAWEFARAWFAADDSAQIAK